MCSDPDLLPDPEPLAAALRPPLLKVFPAALIGRIVVIPYYPLSDQMLGDIVRLQLGRIQKRVAENYRIPLSFDLDVVKLIVDRCTEIESGGRMIDAILTNTVLPRISKEYLEGISAGKALREIHLGIENADFHYRFDY
jgi:type VI secretion system protein VasG